MGIGKIREINSASIGNFVSNGLTLLGRTIGIYGELKILPGLRISVNPSVNTSLWDGKRSSFGFCF